MSKRTLGLLAAGLIVALSSGRMDSLSNQSKKTGSIVGKETKEILEFDPQAPQQVSDSKVRADDPLLYGVQAYGPIIEQTQKLKIEHAVDLFQAENGRYPKDYQEFMDKV